MTAIENVFSPQVYGKMFDMEEKGGKVIGEYLTPFAYLSVFFALGVSLLSEEVIFILTPVPFHGAMEIVSILAMYYGFLFFGKLVGKQLLYAKKTYMTSLLTALTVGINIGLNIPFIMRWGAMGAAWAMLLTGMVSGATGLIISQHYYRIQWEYKKIGMMFGVFCAASIITLLLREAQLFYPVRLAIKGLFLSVYLYMGNQFGIVTLENLAVIKRLFLGQGFQRVRDGSS
jgi:O-antigen/teichoic acid export membrane protein